MKYLLRCSFYSERCALVAHALCYGGSTSILPGVYYYRTRAHVLGLLPNHIYLGGPDGDW